MRALAAAAMAAALALAWAAPAHSQTAVDPAQPAEPAPKVSEKEAIEKAKTHPQAIEAQRDPEVYPAAFRSDSDRDWEVGFFKQGGDQVLQVVVDDESGEIEEAWTGEQISWKMARGYAGAFGRMINAPYIWLPLCLAFLLLLFDFRRPFRIAHLDLLVIVAGFGVSHYFFNLGKIGLSVPLAYPALLYLLARTLWLGFRGGDGLRPSMPTVWIAIAVVALLGFRVGLNVADSNVIDVGYAGVIGADKVSDGSPLYGDFPEDNSHGDTYGPVSYYAYQPFEQVLPWSGDWDDLPAATRSIDLLRPGHSGTAPMAGHAPPTRPERQTPGHSAGSRVGRLPVHGLRPRIEHQRRAGVAPAGRGAAVPDLGTSAWGLARACDPDEVRAGCAGPAVHDI